MKELVAGIETRILKLTGFIEHIKRSEKAMKSGQMIGLTQNIVEILSADLALLERVHRALTKLPGDGVNDSEA